MDSFDDMLAPSRRALEDNPFEDPFAQPRSSSPDPWASYSHHLGDNPFHEEQPTRLHSESENNSEDVSSPDPLESATVNDAEPESSTSESLPQTPTLTSPGFRESAPSPETQSHTILEPEPEPEPEPESTPVSPAQPVTDHQPEPQSPSPISRNSALPIHSSPPSSTFGKLDGVLVSPLDQQSASSGFENSFASLALGAEALGGWQSATHSTFINGANVSISNEPSLDDDDDEDNRPVLRSPRLKAREQVTVCIRVYF
jgi:sorting nexin-1/2